MLTLQQPISDDVLRQAIELRTSACFGAMNIANALAGVGHAPEWEVVRAFTLAALLDEANERGFSMERWKTAVEQKPVTESPLYLAWRKAKTGG